MSDLKTKLTQMREKYIEQLEGCDSKIRALYTQKEQIRGAIYAIDQALTEDKPEPKKEP